MNKNYIKIKNEYIDEISSNVTIYKHIKSGARVCTIENDDNNKVFDITFRTPAINNGGLTHILEHSVLCGSKKYPVKDPFVELLKSSLNTFLNAFTYADKTCYPVASCNLQDFKNLMDVYMDAVFYPEIYQHEEIFRQEGWHYELFNENDPITINGVVYNEMKGAFSNPSDTVSRLVFNSLFKDTSYGFESGGDPKYIPDLDYEEFKEFHKKYYSPSNSYIFIYGNCDMEERLNYLDNEYLSKFDVVDFDTALKTQPSYEKPLYLEDKYSIQKDESLENKDFLTYNVAMKPNMDMKDMLGLGIIVASLFQTPGAPLNELILKEGLAEAVDAYLDTELYQPMLSIKLSNANKANEERFIKLIDDKLNEYVKNGLDKKTLGSMINYLSFKAKEKPFSGRFPQGLMIILNSLSTWLYNENNSTLALYQVKYYDELKKDLESNYFEELLEKYIINNPHKSFVKLIASYDANEKDAKVLEEKLAAYKASLSKEEIKELIEKTKALKEYQQKGDTKEALDTLPKLKKEDLSTEPTWGHLERFDFEYPVLFSNYNVNGINYLNYYFDISGLSNEQVKYVSLFTDLFAQLPTDELSFLDITNFIMENTGTLNSSLNIYSDKNKEVHEQLVISFSALKENVSKVNNFIIGLLNKTNYKDDSLKTRIQELKIKLDQQFARGANRMAAIRAQSNFDLEYSKNDSATGISYLAFITNLINNFDSLKSELITNLEDIIRNFITSANVTIGFTGIEEEFNFNKDNIFEFVNKLNDLACVLYQDTELKNNKEGFKTAYNVNYCAKAGRLDIPYSGSLEVLGQIINYNYLWQKVRVLGGAYGCSMIVNQNDNIALTSYRDPNLENTLKVYDELGDYVSNLELSDDEILGFKISTMSNFEIVMHNKDLASLMQRRYFKGITYDDLKKTKEEIVNSTLSDLKKYGKSIKNAILNGSLCVIGVDKNIEDSKGLFNDVRNLGE